MVSRCSQRPHGRPASAPDGPPSAATVSVRPVRRHRVDDALPGRRLRSTSGATAPTNATRDPARWAHARASHEGDTVTSRCTTSSTESTALLFQGQDVDPGPDRRRPLARPRRTPSPPRRPGTYLYEAGLLPNAQHQVAMGLYGALIVRPADATGRRTPTRRRPSTTRPSSSSARSTRRSTTARPTGRLRHAQVRAALLPDQRQGLPEHRPDPSDRGPTTCCCATSTPATSTTRWACSVPTRRSSPSTAARSTSPAATWPRPSAPARPPTPSSRSPAATADGEAGRLRRQPAAAQQQHGGVRRHAHLPCGHGRRRRPDTAGPVASNVAYSSGTL